MTYAHFFKFRKCAKLSKSIEKRMKRRLKMSGLDTKRKKLERESTGQKNNWNHGRLVKNLKRRSTQKVRLSLLSTKSMKLKKR